MHISLSDRARAVFARDKEAFWWHHFTDEEKELRRMDVWQLAGVIEEAKVRAGQEKRRIVAEHMLDVRLAKIQASASWGSGILGFVGALIGAALSVALSWSLQGHQSSTVTGTTAKAGVSQSGSVAAVQSSLTGVGAASQPASASPVTERSSPSTKQALPAAKNAP